MTSEELKASAERLVSRNGELAWKEHYDGDVPHDFGYDVDDVDDVAKYVLARLAADGQREREDAEPITEEWLSSIDFTNQTMNGWSRLFDGDGSICEIFISHDGDVSICQDSDHVTLSMMPRIATRGQLRKLLEALKGGAS